jgi:signal transduction histidine kinase/ligand-binding sensor domain-containing protein
MRKKLLIHIFFIISTIAAGQSPLRLAFHHLTHEEGLSNNNVFYMHRDSRGFMWLGTLNGLTRFDGINCKIYKPNNSTIKGVRILNIIEDKDGNLWVGSDAGLNFYDRKKDKFFPVVWLGKRDGFVSIPYCVDDKGLLWVNLFDEKHNGLYTYNSSTKAFIIRTEKNATNFVLPPNQQLKEVKTFYCGGSNNKGFYKISFKNNAEVKSETFFDGKNKQPAFDNVGDYVTVENDSTLWITGNPLGLIRFNPLKNTFKTYNRFKEKTLNNFARAVIYRNLLIIGSAGGVYIFDKDKEAFVQHLAHSPFNQNGLMSNWIEIPYIDKDDNLFLSQLGPGIDYTNFNRSLSEHWLTPEDANKLGLSHNAIGGIIRRGNQTWLGQDNLVVLDSNGKYLYKFPFSQPLFCDSQNRQWLTDGKYLMWMNPEKKQSKKFVFKELGENQAWQIHMVEVSRNHYVISSVKGLFEFDELKNKIIPFGEFNLINRATINPLLYDKTSNQIFVSTNWWSSLFVLKKIMGVWKVRKHIGNTAVYTIKPSIDSTKIWLGTKNGLMKIDNQLFDYQLFTEKNGLPDNFVSDIIEESTGNYWLVTGKGISYFDKQKNSYRIFNSKDGAYSKEYNWNAGFLLPDGRAVFGGKNGITVINQDAIKRYNAKPKIQLTQLLVNEKPLKTSIYIGEAKEIELQPEQNSFAFDLVGIEYGFPEKTKIHYQLQRYDKQWITVQNPATVRYSNVSEGIYQFMVKATDEDGNMSSEIKILTVIVHAPFYRTIWFRWSLLLCFLGLSYVFYLFRLRKVHEDAKKKQQILLEQNELLEKQVNERTSELSQSLTELKATQNQLIQSEKLASLGELTAGIAHEIQNPLNFVNNFSELSVELLEELKSPLTPKGGIEEEELFYDITQNLKKISHHGKRASNIVKGMLEHSHTSRGKRVLTDINKLVGECLIQSFQGIKAKATVRFTADFKTNFDENLPKIEIIPQDISRVLSNLINNAFYAVTRLEQESLSKPLVVVSTKYTDNQIIIKVKDNGTGIPENIKSKIFQPFFSTKPTGEGTGLGLSLAYDIITKGYGGTIEFESNEAKETIFTVKLPI